MLSRHRYVGLPHRLLTLLRHWREVRSAFSTLSFLYGGRDDSLDALGGLAEAEMRAVCDWATEDIGYTVVEVGTLFGLTARELAGRVVGGRVIAVDNFSWNPFGLPPAVHEAFTRLILRGTKVDLWTMDSAAFRAKAPSLGRIDMIFFDADHRYEAVKEELLWAKAAGIAQICGHDYGNPNPRFGVTRAVDEVFGRENVEVVGMCWRVKNGGGCNTLDDGVAPTVRPRVPRECGRTGSSPLPNGASSATASTESPKNSY